MSKFKIEILKIAYDELDEIANYYLQVVGKDSAKNITDKILNSISRLADFPLSCPYILDEELKQEEYRVLVCGKYLCIYKLIKETIFIYHIVNGTIEYSKLF